MCRQERPRWAHCVRAVPVSRHPQWGCGPPGRSLAAAWLRSLITSCPALPQPLCPCSPAMCTALRVRHSVTAVAMQSPRTSTPQAAGKVQQWVVEARGCAGCWWQAGWRKVGHRIWALQRYKAVPLNSYRPLRCRHQAMVDYFAPGSWQGPRCRGGCDNCAAAASGGSLQRNLAAEARLLLATVQV